MSKLQKGDTYCTMWTTNLAGPFTYDGVADIMHDICIPATEGKIMHAQGAFEFLKSLYTIEDTGNGTLSIPFTKLLDDEVIDNAIASHPGSSFALNILKEFAPRMKELLGEGCE